MKTRAAWRPLICAIVPLGSLLGVVSLGCSSDSPTNNGSGGSSSGEAGMGARAGMSGGSAGSDAQGGASAGAGGSAGGKAGSSGSGGSGGTGGSVMGGSGGMAGMGGGGMGGAMPIVPDFPPGSDFPYVLTNYDEPYRGQFHFSAPMGWLNDANGMWFDGGLYHLAYQAWPWELGGPAKVWGHASSPDLVHWTHWPIMLHPGVNGPGDGWSGSTVVDTDNTSGLKQGDGPVLVTFYTCTSLGTCVSYSNDHGITWKAYDKNPVAIGSGDFNTSRDPHVFWHAPTKQWVCVAYVDEASAGEHGNTFYTSKDLKNWTKASDLDFGFECPDFYELPVDGDTKNTKWVLQDAGGNYLLGGFDGQKFTPDSNNARNMDSSGVFYASQTFYRRNFPDDRVIQMPWLRDFGQQGKVAPWDQSIGFPVQVQLKTFADGVQVARSPIAEIEKLYGMSQHFTAAKVAQDANPFAALSSKTFDLSLDIDVAGTTAKNLKLTLGDLDIAIDLANRQIYGRTFSVIDGHVMLRVLRDWSMFELFVNEGEVAHTDSHLFDPQIGGIGLTGDGAVSLASADFHEVGRAWPGVAATSSVMIDDTNAATIYTGTANQFNEGRYFQGTCHVFTQNFEVSFTGTRVEWYGLKNVDLGFADVYVDDQLAGADIDCYDPLRQNALLFTQGKLLAGDHKLRVVAKGTKNAASSGAALVHDYVIAYVDP